MIRKNYSELKYKNHGTNRIFLYKDGNLLNQFTNIKNCYEFLLENDKNFDVTYNSLYRALIDRKNWEYKNYNFEWFNSYIVFAGVEMPIYKPSEEEKQEIKRELKEKFNNALIEELIEYLYERSEHNE